MGFRRLLAMLFFCSLAGCAPQSDPPANQGPVPAAQIPETNGPIRTGDLSPATKKTLSDIREIIETGSLRRLARYADTHENFTSNFGTDSHYDYWYLLRRTGVEPLDQLTAILDQPHGDIIVGNQKWHIWPDFAALPENARDPARMDRETRARLVSLIGEPAANAMSEGKAYPGIRTAIAEDGRWIYWLFDTGEPN